MVLIEMIIKNRTLICLIALFGLISCREEKSSVSHQTLNNFCFYYPDSSKNFHAEIPGSIHTDLLKNNLIKDPFYGTNEDSLQWIGKKEWIYESKFVVSPDILEKKNIFLVFEGLDTYAVIFLNGEHIFFNSNMFTRHSEYVKGILNEDTNTLRVIFYPPEHMDSMRAMKCGVELPDPRAFSRKAPYHYGWDWGPKFLTCGIWKPVYLEGWNNMKINSVLLNQDSITDSIAKITTRIEIISDTNLLAEVKLTIQGESGKEIKKQIMLKKGINLVQVKFDMDDPQLWWTHDLGEPYLYDVKVSVGKDDEISDTKNFKTGLRHIELVTEADSIGESFYFRLNGIPLYIKGANYIPQDVFLPGVEKKDYENIIKSALDANMNMLRVWGGGVYERDIFYDLCDRYGILVWQDFMFACNMYPGNTSFVNNVEKEITQQVKRLMNHPCIALWCGNNEVDEGWKNWGWQKALGYSEEDSIKVWHDYLEIFHEVIPDILSKYDPNSSYHPSSPRIGWGHPESLQEGDSHYWGVWWGAEPFEVYEEKVGRFMSEYGFQAFPSFAAIDSFAGKNDRYLYSDVMKTHQKHPRGFELIDEYMKRDYPIPEDFDDYVYVSQLLQAEGISKAIHAHRRARPYCMGTLYWQLNDCWPVISWSSLDYYGNWKALHYFVKCAYEKIIISFEKKNEMLNVYLVSDSVNDVAGKLRISLIDFYGNELKQDIIETEAPSLSSYIVKSIYVSEFIGSYNPEEVFLHAGFLTNVIDPIATSNYFFVKPKELSLPASQLEIDVTKYEKGYKLSLTSDVLEKNVFLHINENGRFSDNFFDLLPMKEKIVYFETEEKIEDFKERSVVFNLN